MTRVAVTVTSEDIQTYFSGYLAGSNKFKWRSEIDDDGAFFAGCGVFSVALDPKDFIYHVKIWSTEDKSDSDENTTDNPIEFISEFLGTGGSEEFLKQASTPAGLSKFLNLYASKIERGIISRAQFTKTIRRVSSILTVARDTEIDSKHLEPEESENIPEPTKVDADYEATPSGKSESLKNIETFGLKKLISQLKKKGWKFEESEDRVKVNIGDEFEAEITVDHMMWGYVFKLNETDVGDEGSTDDPIEAFENFKRSKEVSEGWKKLKGNSVVKRPSSVDRPTGAPELRKFIHAWIGGI